MSTSEMGKPTPHELGFYTTFARVVQDRYDNSVGGLKRNVEFDPITKEILIDNIERCISHFGHILEAARGGKYQLNDMQNLDKAATEIEGIKGYLTALVGDLKSGNTEPSEGIQKYFHVMEVLVEEVKNY